MKHKHKAMQQP